MKKKASICLVLTLVLAATAALAWPRASADSDVANGIGETLLLVVADVVPPAEGPARLSEVNRRFGELDGFHLDATDGYVVRAALPQSSPEATRVSCPRVGAMVTTTIVGKVVDLECPLDLAYVDVPQPVQLTYVPRADYGSIERPHRDRFAELFGDDLRLRPELSMIAAGFRSKNGAEEFLEFARSAGLTDLVTIQVHKAAGGDIGLGQEPHPDGGGPLSGPLDDQEAFQR